MLYVLRAIETKGEDIKFDQICGVFTEDKIERAREIAINNETDLWETCYNYIVIVKIPENTLYVDCYAELFELYKVVVPPYKTLEEYHKIKLSDVKYEKVKEEEIPDFILNYFTPFLK